MKLFRPKFNTLLSMYVVAIMLASSPSADAQFFKKLSKGLEKINKTLEDANKGLDNLTKGSLIKKSETKDEKKSTPSQEDSQSNEAEVQSPEQKKEPAIDDSRWNEAEPIYNTPYITSNTRFLRLDDYDEFSSVNDGVFAIRSRNKFSFWKITGEKLFDEEWEYCGTEASFSNDFPIFNSGAVPARRITPNSKGQKLVCLLYANGAIKELDPSWKVVTNFVDGLAMVKKVDISKVSYFYINIKGEKVYPQLEVNGDDKVCPLSEGLRAHKFTHNSWGYIDANGKVVISPIQSCFYAGEFSEGYAWIKKNEDPTQFTSMYAEYYLIDKTGKVVFNPGDVQTDGYVSPVKNGMFYVYKNGKYNYYDTNFKLLASYDAATPFYNGYAYVSKTGNYSDGVDVINTKFKKIKNFSSSSFDGSSSLTYQPRFDPLGLGLVKDSDVDNYFINAKGDIILSAYEKGNFGIERFLPFTESGYAQFGVGNWGNDKYCGFLRPDGEIVLVLSYQDIEDARKQPWPVPPPGDTIPEIFPEPIPLPWPPDTVVIVKERPPIGPIIVERTFYNVTVSIEGEGTASISPTGRFEYGDKATLSVSPAKDWAVASITHDADGRGVISANNAFTVTSNIHIKVKFAKKDDDQEPQHTGCYQGEKELVIENYSYGNITYYAQINASKTDANPYGDNTYGFIVAMIDPVKKYVEPDVSCNMFSAPFRISGYQLDKETGRKWMVLDGGSFTIGNLKLNPGGNGLAGLYFHLVMSMNGFSQPTLSARHYRLEMIEHDEETGEFTAGILQAYSPEHGWLNAGDSRLKKTTKGFLMEAYDSGMPINYFEGVAFKQSQKRDDVRWYPPVEWYNNNQSTLQGIIDCMRESYLTNKSDYEEMFGL
ncbi:MAG: WG repeat-containing protein [Muribaculaceae bacterium]|nr:WG repeat-containing protein [Muribaculaceae bacterium]